MSPRTVKYVEATVREGDSFDYRKWLKRVREQEARAKQAEATGTSGELAEAAIDKPIRRLNDQHDRPSPTLRFTTRSMRASRALRRLDGQHTSQTPKARLRRWLEKVRRAWDDFQTSRPRDAVYGYLEAVFAIVVHYKVRRRINRLLRHAFAFANLRFDKKTDPFIAVIRCTSERDIDKKMVSKYARALRYASRRKEPDMRLKTFMKEAGGVNACASLYAKQLGRNNRVAAI